MINRANFFSVTESKPSTPDAIEHTNGENAFFHFLFHPDLQEKSFATTFHSQLECKGVTVSNPNMPVTLYFPTQAEMNTVLEKHQDNEKLKSYREIIELIEMPFIFYINELIQTNELPDSAIYLLRSIPYISDIMDFKKNIFHKDLLHKLLIQLQDSYSMYLIKRIAEMKYTPLSTQESHKILSLIDLTPSIEAFKFTAYYGTNEMIEKFLDNGFNINELFSDPSKKYIIGNTTPLMHAASKGNIPVISVLLKRGAQINCSDDAGYTALMHAASHSQLDAVKLLLTYHADINKKDKNGRTARDLSCIYNSVLFDSIIIDKNEAISKLLSDLEPSQTRFLDRCIIN